jgi:WD40 repeat protein
MSISKTFKTLVTIILLLNLLVVNQASAQSDIKLSSYATLQGHKGMVTSLSISPNNKLLATASNWSEYEPYILLWDVVTGRKVDELKLESGSITKVVFSPDGKYLAASTDRYRSEPQVLVWDIETRTLLHTLKGHEDSVTSLIFTPDGRTIVSGGDDGKVFFWDVQTGAEIVSPITVPNAVKSLAYNAQRDYIAIGQQNNMIQIISKHGERIKTLTDVFEDGQSWLTDLQFSPDGKLLVTSSSFVRYNQPAIFNVDQDFQQQPLLNNQFSPGYEWDKWGSFTFSSNGKFIITTPAGGEKLIVFLTETGEFVSEMKDRNFYSFYNPTISSDLKTIALGDWNEIQLVDSRELVNFKKLTRIEIAEKNAENKLTLNQDEQQKINVLGIFDNNTQETLKDVTWKSSNPFTVIVKDGNIIAREIGKTTLTATYGSFTTSIEVEVTPPDKKLIGLKLETKTQSLRPKYETEFTVKGIFDNGTEEDIPVENLTVTTSDYKVISIYKNLIVANGYGSAEVLVNYKGQEASTTIKVVKLSTPSVDEMTEKSKIITGRTEPNFVVTAKYGGKVLGASIADQNGKFSISITPLKAGAVVVVVAKDEKNNLSPDKKVIVKDITPPKAPAISKITSKSIVIKGKAEANSTVFVKIGSKTYKVKVNAKGDFSLKISPLKKGTMVQAEVVDLAGNKGKSVKIKVQ